MEKKSLETFIKKYNLNGLVEQVCWVVKDKTLKVVSCTADKKFMTSILQKKFDALDDVEMGIVNTSGLKQLLAALSDNISLSLVCDSKDATRVTNLVIEDDGESRVSHVCGSLDVIPDEPKIKQIPEFEVELTLTDNFIDRFLKAKSSLKSHELFTVLQNKKKQKLEMVLGYNSRNNTDHVSVPLFPVAGKDSISAPLSFSSNNLKDILAVNPEVKDPILKISTAGLAFIEFNTPEFQSQYYMIKIESED